MSTTNVCPDRTTFAKERQAQFYENTIVRLWDSLLGHDKYAALEGIEFDELLVAGLGDAIPIDAGVAGILRIESGTAAETLSREEFVERLREFREAGWAIVETEWHHSGFEPESEGRPAPRGKRA